MKDATSRTEAKIPGDRIVRDPAILVGKPTIKGTRIPVDLVLAYLERNPSFDDLFADYPRLTIDDVQAYSDRILSTCNVTSPANRVPVGS